MCSRRLVQIKKNHIIQSFRRATRCMALWHLIFVLLLPTLGCVPSAHVQRGDNAFARGDLENALAAYQAAQAQEPESQEIARKIRNTRSRLIATYTEWVDGALMREDFVGALAVVRRAKRVLSIEPAMAPLIEEVVQATLANARLLHQQKNYAEILRLYDSLGTALPSDARRARPFFEDVKREWSAVLIERATAAAHAFPPRKEEALLLYAKAAQLTGNPDLRRTRDSLRKEVLDTWKYVVHIHPESNAQIRLSIARYGEGTALHVVPSPEDRDATATISLENMRFDRQPPERRVVNKTYKSGDKTVSNPAYESIHSQIKTEKETLLVYEQEVVDCQNEVEEITREHAAAETPVSKKETLKRLDEAKRTCDAQRKERDAQHGKIKKLEGEYVSPYRLEPIFSDISYNVDTEAVTAEVDLVIRIDHEDGRTPIILSEKLVHRVIEESHASVPELGLPANPMVLPDSESMLQELHRQALLRARTALDQSYAQWRQELLIQARHAKMEEKRVEYYVAYILTDPAIGKPSHQESVDGLLGIFDATRVLLSEL
jgi:tetratricopeptide (TPR) repeat protein